MNPVITSANGGELSTLMGGRLDNDKFHDGCITLENCICLVQGPSVRRGGLRHVAEAKDSSTAVRLLPFEVGVDAAYVIEAGEEYFRFYKDLARLEAAGTPVEVVTPFQEDQLFELHHAQSADLLYLVHEALNPRKLSRLTSDGLSWGFNSCVFRPPALYEVDSDYSGGTITISPAAITGDSVEVLASAAVFLAADADRLIKYSGGRASIASYDGTTQITVDILDDFPAALAPETGAGTVTTVGTAATFSVAHGLAVGNWVRLTGGAQSGEKRRVTAVPTTTTATLASAFSADQSAGVAWSKDKEIAAGSWLMGGSPVATCTPSAYTPVGKVITLSLGAAGWRQKDVDLGKYVVVNSGLVKLTTYSSTTAVKGEIVKVLSSASVAAGGDWSAKAQAWSTSRGYPSAICFYGEALVLAGTTAQPTTFWRSEVGDYENFAEGTNDGDAFSRLVTGLGVNQIRWLSPGRALMGGTAKGEFSITGESGGSLTPTSVLAQPETTHGGSSVTPVRIGHMVLFVQTQGRKVRELYYDYGYDSFIAPDITRFAEHVTEGGIVDMAYQQETESILWCVRADGVLLGCTYNREEKVWGWHRHVTDGYFESVCVIPDNENHRDQLWAVVRRTIGGVTKRFIEVLDPDLPHADSFVEYEGAAATEISGLSHLEGEAVDVVADGFVVSGHTVSAGKITLAKAASHVIVGLHYESTDSPMPPDYVDDQGRTTIGKKKQWTEVILRLKDTGLAGVTVNGKTTPARAGSDPLGSAPALFTGDAAWNNLGTDTAGILTIKQTLPLPYTRLAITGTLEVSK